jgi:regulatory protein
MLGQRALSRAEVTQRLERRGFQPSVVRAEVARLERAKLLDDAALARAVCQAQLRSGRGRRALTAALRRRGVIRATADLALAEVDEESESPALAAAFATATRKHKWWRRLPEERRKVIRYLLARGFSLDQARRALHENGRDEPHGEETDDAGDPPGLP